MRQKAHSITNQVDPVSVRLTEESKRIWVCYYERRLDPKDVLRAHNSLLDLNLQKPYATSFLVTQKTKNSKRNAVFL